MNTFFDSPALQIESLTYTYSEGTQPAVSGLNLTVSAGEIVLLAGSSGSGKSTLLRCASGVAPHLEGGRLEGSVAVFGRNTRQNSPSQLSDTIGVLFQDPETQVVMNTVAAELSLPLERAGSTPAQIARGIEEVALTVGIEHLLERKTSELSGGELQRVALAAALAPRPALLLLDEPCSQLDPAAGDELLWLLRRLSEDWGTTVVLAEHRLERGLPIADRVIAMDAGQITCDLAPAEFLNWAAESNSDLLTPGAELFLAANLSPLPTSVKSARATLRQLGIASQAPATGTATEATQRKASPSLKMLGNRRTNPDSALSAKGLWHEVSKGPSILRGIDLELSPGERVALVGRNGAGKSTLLRHFAGLQTPTRGKLKSSGRVGMLLQNPGDYFLHDTVGAEASADALKLVGLQELAWRHPRDLSGGQRQRLALAIVLDSEEPPAVLCLDEPTRGMDRPTRAALLVRLAALADSGTAIIMATHDCELAAAFAQRIVLLAAGRVIADAPTSAVLGGGWHFTTEVARILGNQGALLPADGAKLLLDHGNAGGYQLPDSASQIVPTATVKLSEQVT